MMLLRLETAAERAVLVQALRGWAALNPGEVGGAAYALADQLAKGPVPTVAPVTSGDAGVVVAAVCLAEHYATEDPDELHVIWNLLSQISHQLVGAVAPRLRGEVAATLMEIISRKDGGRGERIWLVERGFYVGR